MNGQWVLWVDGLDIWYPIMKGIVTEGLPSDVQTTYPNTQCTISWYLESNSPKIQDLPSWELTVTYLLPSKALPWVDVVPGNFPFGWDMLKPSIPAHRNRLLHMEHWTHGSHPWSPALLLRRRHAVPLMKVAEFLTNGECQILFLPYGSGTWLYLKGNYYWKGY